MKHLAFGYGSLINIKSLLSSVPDAIDIQPGYIKGFRREFSLLDPEGWTTTNLDVAGMPFCALDIRPTNSQERVNGVVFAVSEVYFHELLRREKEYQQIKTTVYDYSTDEPLGECLVFSSGKNNGTFEADNKAQQRYVEVCLEGARAIGPRFYEEFLASTYIGGNALLSQLYS